MKLVSIHKQILILLFLFIGISSTMAQKWSIQQCIDTAQLYNNNLQISRNNIELLKVKEREARAHLMPKITANGDYKYFINLPYQLMPLSTFNPSAPDGQYKEAQFGVPHNINANILISMPIYNPQIYGSIQSTKLGTELSVLQYKKTEEQIYIEISNLYYNAQILYHQLLFIDSNLINAKKLLESTQLLNTHLLAKSTDVSKVKLQVSQLTSQKENISYKYDQILNALKFSMGISSDRKIEIESEVIYEYNTNINIKPILDIDIIKTQNQLLSKDLSVLKKSKVLPSISIIGMYGTTGFGYDKQPNDFLKFYPVAYGGVQISYPIFNGTVIQRKIEQKKIEIKNTELQIGAITEQNRMQIENVILQKKVAKKSIETTIEQIELAKNIYLQTILLQKQGTVSLTDVLLANNTLNESQQLYITAIVDYLKADLEFKKLTGNISLNK